MVIFLEMCKHSLNRFPKYVFTHTHIQCLTHSLMHSLMHSLTQPLTH